MIFAVSCWGIRTTPATAACDIEPDPPVCGSFSRANCTNAELPERDSLRAACPVLCGECPTHQCRIGTDGKGSYNAVQYCASQTCTRSCRSVKYNTPKGKDVFVGLGCDKVSDAIYLVRNNAIRGAELLIFKAFVDDCATDLCNPCTPCL